MLRSWVGRCSVTSEAGGCAPLLEVGWNHVSTCRLLQEALRFFRPGLGSRQSWLILVAMSWTWTF